MLQEEKQQVILITMKKDEYKAAVEHLKQEVILITKERDQLKSMVDHAEQYSTSQLDLVQALTWAHDFCAPPLFFLFRAYELERDVLLNTLELPHSSQLDSSLFDLV